MALQEAVHEWLIARCSVLFFGVRALGGTYIKSNNSVIGGDHEAPH